MTSVKNQSQCGSCWAFSAVGITEAIFNIDRNNSNLDLDLSEEELNSDASAAGSCCGGWHDQALNYIKNTGIPDEPCLPYDVPYYNTGDCDCYPNPPCNAACTGLPGSCSQLNATDACADIASRLVTIADYGAVPDDEEQIKEKLIEKGPLSVCLAMSGRTDAAGVYRCTTCWDRNNDAVCNTVGVCAGGVCTSGIVGQNCTSDAQCDEDKNNDGACNQNDCGINHCVVLVGYDDGGGHWIAKNSWGATWGVHNNGYWEVGYGECHIETEVYYAEAGDLPNQPPVADADGPYSEECQGATSTVPLDGTGSSDPDAGDTLTYSWTTDCPGGSFGDASSATPTLTVDTSLDCVVACEVSLTVDDGLETDSSSSMVTIEDTTPPSLTAPADITWECTSPAGTPVPLGTPTVSDICDPSPAVADDAPALFPLGTTSVTWSAKDKCGKGNTATQDVTIVDTTPPEVALSVTPEVLWPPNHRLVPVNVVASVSDVCDENPVCQIVSVGSNEPVNGSGDGNTAPDWETNGDLEVSLRAERSGNGNGRLYSIMVECSDASGKSSAETVTVSVPHDKGKKKGKKK
jgi:hypothetical protein